MVGLRGVGKTVLLDQMADDAQASGIQVVRLEAPEGRLISSAIGTPASPSFRIARICDSLNLDFRMYPPKPRRAQFTAVYREGKLTGSVQ